MPGTEPGTELEMEPEREMHRVGLRVEHEEPALRAKEEEVWARTTFSCFIGFVTRLARSGVGRVGVGRGEVRWVG